MSVRSNAMKKLLSAAEHLVKENLISARNDLRDAIVILEGGSIKPAPVVRVRSYFMPGLSGGCTVGA